MISFEYIQCPLNRHYTFSVKESRLWVEKACEGKVLNVFAGTIRLDAEVGGRA